MAAQKNASSKDVRLSMFTKRTDRVCVCVPIRANELYKKNTSELRSRKTNYVCAFIQLMNWIDKKDKVEAYFLSNESNTFSLCCLFVLVSNIAPLTL